MNYEWETGVASTYPGGARKKGFRGRDSDSKIEFLFCLKLKYECLKYTRSFPVGIPAVSGECKRIRAQPFADISCTIERSYVAFSRRICKDYFTITDNGLLPSAVLRDSKRKYSVK